MEAGFDFSGGGVAKVVEFKVFGGKVVEAASVAKGEGCRDGHLKKVRGNALAKAREAACGRLGDGWSAGAVGHAQRAR